MIFTGAAHIDDPIDIYTCHTLLHDAVTLNRPELFKFLVAQGANLNVKDQNGCTPLMKAASIGRMEMCQVLIENGVDPRDKDLEGQSSLEKAKIQNNIETERYLS